MNDTPPRARAFLNSGFGVAGFVLICAFLHLTLPFPEIGVVAAQLRFFKNHGDQYNTVFIGSSLTHHDLSPAIYDRAMAERGHATRSFNFGVNGMLVAESSFVLERLLETKPKRLKWVFIELDELDPRPFAGAGGSRRDVYWRDAKRTAWLLRKVFETGGKTDSVEFSGSIPAAEDAVHGSEKGKIELLLFHLRHFAKNIANVSRRVDLEWWSTHFWKPDKMPEDLGPDGDGYAPFTQEFAAEKIVAYEFALSQALERPEEKVVSDATERACRAMAAEVRKAGATPIFLVMPVISQTKLRFRPEAADLGPVLTFNDARAFPELYRIDMRAEEIHLNPKGAEALSKRVAEGAARLIDEQKRR